MRIYLAIIHALRGDLDVAHREAAAACSLATLPAMEALARGVYADVLLALGRVDEAIESARRAMELLDARGGLEDGEMLVRLVYAQAMIAHGSRDEALRALDIGRSRMQTRASQIHQPNWRSVFLREVPENARLLQLARDWLGE